MDWQSLERYIIAQYVAVFVAGTILGVALFALGLFAWQHISVVFR